MTQRDLILTVVVGLCIILVAWLLIAKPFSPGYPASPKDYNKPTGIHVFCMNCNYETESFKASGHDPNWPKECPQCKEQKLMLARKCEHCGKTTESVVDGDMRPFIKCRHCGKKVRLTPPSADELRKMPQVRQ